MFMWLWVKNVVPIVNLNIAGTVSGYSSHFYSDKLVGFGPQLLWALNGVNPSSSSTSTSSTNHALSKPIVNPTWMCT